MSSPIYQMLTSVYQTLRDDATLTGLIGSRLYTEARTPLGGNYPYLFVWIESAVEDPATGALTDCLLSCVARDLGPDGDGTPLALIYERVDTLLNGVVYRGQSAMGRFSRKGFAVNYGAYDTETQDYFKAWRYRAIVKHSV